MQKKPVLFRMFLGFCHGRTHLQNEANLRKEFRVPFITEEFRQRDQRAFSVICWPIVA